MSNSETDKSIEGIAIIGIAGRFPQAKNLDEFWQNLREGVESISVLSETQLLSSGIDPTMFHSANHVKAGAILEDMDLFDASFFGFNPREAAITDPQQRLFLEEAWSALENAGYDSERYRGQIGVYAGVGWNSYLLFNLASNRGFLGTVIDYQTLIGNDKDHLAPRTSYKLNLRGPSISVQTNCSTSLVAVHLACQSLLSYQCDMALAGGVAVNALQKAGYLYQEGGVLSPNGQCRAFDAGAKGTVPGGGLGIVVLKRLEEAIADGDCIHAVIKSSAINNDGSGKVGYTAPSLEGQARAIAEAFAIADIEPETVTYVETHGTATALGDPIEFKALTKAFRASTQRKTAIAPPAHCAIGSVKTNIGHLDVASGIAGLLKTVLALKHKLIPPSLHFQQPNPEIDLANSPFYVNTALSEWPANGTPRRAGVSSFGLGGTNAHAILEEAPTVESSGPSRPWQLLVLSAKTASALDAATVNLSDRLKQNPDLNLADVAYTLQVGRRVFDHRRAVVCKDIQDAAIALSDPKRVLTLYREAGDRTVAFMFPGLGTHYPNMARELYQVEPVFREQLDRCCQLFQPYLDLDLRSVLYPSQPETDAAPKSGLDLRKMLGRSQEQLDPAAEKLNQTFLTQPAIFAIEYALAQLLISWGIRPGAAIGYSIGEYVAACLAGVFSLEDAIALVAKRALMIQSLPAGKMLAVGLSEAQVRPLLGKGLSLSAVNGPSLCAIAGVPDAVDELERQLTESGLACRPIPTSHAFHSQMMDAIALPFIELVKTFNLQPPKIPYLSNVTGTWITPSQATDPSYWAKHLCQPVLFANGVQELWKKQNLILLEVGPGQTLSSLAVQCKPSDLTLDWTVLPTLRNSCDRQSDVAFLLNTLGQLWLAGVQIDWQGFYADERRHRVPLPTYPFERQRYWIEPQKQVLTSSEKGTEQQQENSKIVESNIQNFARPNLRNAYMAPSNEIERTIADLYQELLGIEQVGIHDNFFEMGGNSLIGIQLLSQIRKLFQIELPLRYLFAAPTVAEFALAIEEAIVAELEELTEEEAKKLVLVGER